MWMQSAIKLTLAFGVVLIAAIALAEEVHEVTVVSHGWHTGLILAREDLPSSMAPVLEHLDETPWVEFGWGDRRYYQRGEGRPWLLVPAALWPTEAVMHVVAVPQAAQQYFPESDQTTVSIEAGNWAAFTDALSNSFADGAPESATYLGVGLYGDSAFFTGSGRFHLRRTCNTWTLEMLAAGGLLVDPTGTIRARGVMRQVKDL